jgi:nicotinate-nucleotide--dimethylbenzimidazole phosphoribosyltransferase
MNANSDIVKAIQKKIDEKTKPIGSLGLLEQLGLQIAAVQQTLTPQLIKPSIVVFAADHGINENGVSLYPTEVTAQMVYNFLNEGAAINVFCKQNNINLYIVDSGVKHEFNTSKNLINAKVAMGTKNILVEPAMSETQVLHCFKLAEQIIDDIHKDECNIIGFGEMGIGNTSSAALLMHWACNIPLDECVGAGTGLNTTQIEFKRNILNQALQKHKKPTNAIEALSTFGGFEIAQMCGAMLHSYSKNMLIMVDGFIATASFLCAHSINPNIITNAIFCHQSGEQGHKAMLNFLNVKSILNLNMKLGEGTGCALAYPLLKSAVKFINEMASFENAGVSTKI